MNTKESQIEQDFIKQLTELKYIYRSDIRTKNALNKNFREKFEKLNDIKLSDSEFKRLCEKIIHADVFSAASALRQRNSFTLDNGKSLHYTLVNIKDWCKNSFEVINQIQIKTDKSHHRYDVILLINGIPVVQIELKNLEISPRKAMKQIIDYKEDSGNGYKNTLFCFIQIFIVSNRSNTWYFVNNNKTHFRFNAEERFLPIYQFATPTNEKISHLDDFTGQLLSTEEAFLSKCHLGEMISRYMVLIASEQKLMMMRPYQVYAVKAIVDCIEQNRGNGYIWHTTGSGKTLTSFKASTLLKDNPNIEKCLFVVDRKDLDRQTREEFNKFQEACVEENTNTETLVKRLLSQNYSDKVIVTTIQKLGLALDGSQKRDGRQKRQYKQRLEPLRDKRVIFIFDECHRSQFGENHKAIKDFFPNAQLFGFTGTPIFEENASIQQREGEQKTLKTTQDIFTKQLHAYTITHAIEDDNVLRFHVDYFKPENNTKLTTKHTKNAIIDAILDKHQRATRDRKFNAVLATASINDAIEYYQLFKSIQAERQDQDFILLNIACVFSPPADGNKDVSQLQEDLLQEKIDNEENPTEKKAALNAIMRDYNAQYNTNHDLSNFDLYYQDIQKRIKDQQYSNNDLKHSQKIDIVIVVDMLLTGFDSKYLNTLYVDKNLKYHGLIQAFSRTNRVLNDTKPYGNILDFRGQQDAVDEAITLFSGEKKNQAKKIWLVDTAPMVVEQLQTAMNELEIFMQSKGLACEPEQVANLKGDKARAEFINRFKVVQKLKNNLEQYTDLTLENSANIDKILPSDQFRAFRGMYLDTAHRLRQPSKDGDSSELVQQLDFNLVLFASALVDYDYIMSLIANFSQNKSKKQKANRDQLVEILSSYSNIYDERDDILAFVDSLKVGENLSEEAIHQRYALFKAEQTIKKLQEIAQQYGINSAALEAFFNMTVERSILDGDQLTEVFEPLGLGWKARGQQEQALVNDLKPLLYKSAQGRDISGLLAY